MSVTRETRNFWRLAWKDKNGKVRMVETNDTFFANRDDAIGAFSMVDPAVLDSISKSSEFDSFHVYRCQFKIVYSFLGISDEFLDLSEQVIDPFQTTAKFTGTVVEYPEDEASFYKEQSEINLRAWKAFKKSLGSLPAGRLYLYEGGKLQGKYESLGEAETEGYHLGKPFSIFGSILLGFDGKPFDRNKKRPVDASGTPIMLPEEYISKFYRGKGQI